MAATSSVSDSVSLSTDDEQDSLHNIEWPGLTIRDIFRSMEHEIARDHEECSRCSGVRAFLEEKRWESSNVPCCFTLRDVIHNSGTCAGFVGSYAPSWRALWTRDNLRPINSRTFQYIFIMRGAHGKRTS